MNSEKVKKIKKALEDNATREHYNSLWYMDDCKCITVFYADILALINELESENETLRNAKVVYETVDYCAEDLRKAQDRIAELEKENDEQYKRIMELEQDLVHADENVFYRECDVALQENKIKTEALKKFAERLKIESVNKIHETLKEFIK